MMCKRSYSLYQSGEQVTVPGLYVLVDKPTHEKQPKVFEFRSGQLFPDDQGRAVCWVIVTASEEKHGDEAPIYTPWQSKNRELKLH